MFKHVRANVVGYAALFVALSGTSYAVTRLPKDAVGNRQLKDRSVGTKELKNGAVTKAKLAKSVLPKLATSVAGPAGTVGPAGPQGPQGDRGPQGGKGDPGPSAGRTVTSSVSSATACRNTESVRRTITVPTTSRIFSEANLSWYGTSANNSVQATISLRDSGGGELGQLTGLSFWYGVANYVSEQISGVISDADQNPVAVPPGTYALVLTVFPYGTCANTMSFSKADLTYLRIADAD
jgi:hypothetical protein